MGEAWSQYQEEAAAFFRTLGWSAETNVTMKGPRTEHDIDVVVKSRQAGFEVVWLVECKLWSTRVTKDRVLTFRTIVHELGADRGLLLAENGFQSGAVEAAALTNVQVTTLAEVRKTSEAQVFALRLSDIYDRTSVARDRYWDMPKSMRVQQGLRPEAPDDGYSGDHTINLMEEMLRQGFRGQYPFEVTSLYRFVRPEVPEVVSSPQELVRLLDSLISELERRLDAADRASAAQS